MSLGHHWGAHDGTEAEERYHALLAQDPGKIICISAGNEREDNLHLGKWFNQREEQAIEFAVFRPEDPTEAPGAAMTIWYGGTDQFSLTLFAPDGSEYVAPILGQLEEYETQRVVIRIGRGLHPWNNLVQTEIILSFSKNAHPVQDLRGWKLKIRCDQAVVGRLDAWFANSGQGVFLSHPLVEQARTISLSATGEGCIAVAGISPKLSGSRMAAPRQGREMCLAAQVALAAWDPRGTAAANLTSRRLANKSPQPSATNPS